MMQSENKADDVWVTMEHIRMANGCARGAKAWFEQYHIDFKAFCRNGGISSHIILATGDAMAVRVVNIARSQYGR